MRHAEVFIITGGREQELATGHRNARTCHRRDEVTTVSALLRVVYRIFGCFIADKTATFSISLSPMTPPLFISD